MVKARVVPTVRSLAKVKGNELPSESRTRESVWLSRVFPYLYFLIAVVYPIMITVMYKHVHIVPLRSVLYNP